jgi:excisionase family DNA binding protein
VSPHLEPLLTVEELAQWLKIPKGSLYNLVHERRLPFIKIGHRVRFERGAVQEWLNSSIHLATDGPRDLAAFRTRASGRGKQRGA